METESQYDSGFQQASPNLRSLTTASDGGNLQRLDASIESVARINSALGMLLDRIDPSPQEESSATEKQLRSCPSLRELLTGGPGRIEARVEQALKQIEQIEDLLFS